ncbi:MAG: DUF882 domain-containing protein [Afipia sp.]|nr:DUF882 domain-containing protein [Afipia sp.]
MAGRFPRSAGPVSLPRAGLRAGLAALLLIAGARSVHNATADADTRTLTFHHTHSDEDLTVTFKRNGRYDEAVLKKINHFLRDWRSQDETTMDRRLFDIIWEVYRDVDGKQPIQIISAYRSPATNAMLRRRSSGVARFSQHMQGHAMDFFIPGVPLEQIRFAGLRLQRGGVGFYPTSGSPFVHLDVGNIRYWPRMSREQLVKVFPDQKTVYLPSDGKPLAGYELAKADIEKRGDGTEAPASPSGGLLAGLLFHKHSDDEDEAGSAVAENAGLKAKTIAAVETVAAKAEKIVESIPLPRAKPAAAATVQIAAAEPQTVAIATTQKPAVARADTTPVDVINARGFWDNEQVAKVASPVQSATQKARAVVASADPQPTAGSATSPSDALAYAPVTPPLDKSKIVASTGTADSAPDEAGNRPAKILRLASTQMSELWLRAMILAPSASRSLRAAVLGDQDMTVMRAHFVKPKTSLAMTFSDDPQMGLICERFTGPATVLLQTTTFGMRTAALR